MKTLGELQAKFEKEISKLKRECLMELSEDKSITMRLAKLESLVGIRKVLQMADTVDQTNELIAALSFMEEAYDDGRDGLAVSIAGTIKTILSA